MIPAPHVRRHPATNGALLTFEVEATSFKRYFMPKLGSSRENPTEFEDVLLFDIVNESKYIWWY